MPTNEERREVAARLQRIIGKCKYDYSLCVLYDESIGGNCEAVERNVEECDNECFDSLLARLADLIEPEERTCRDASTVPCKFTCSECHQSWRKAKGNGAFAYCPCCGARVVDR